MIERRIETERGVIMMRYCRIEEADRSFDIEFWQIQSAEARWNAAWEMADFVYRLKGGDPNAPRLQRSVEAYGRLPG